MLTEEEHIIIRTPDEEAKFNALRARPFTHTYVYDRYMLLSTRMFTEFPKVVGWQHLYVLQPLGSCLLNLEFLRTLDTYPKAQKILIYFRLFGEAFEVDLKPLSKLMVFLAPVK